MHALRALLVVLVLAAVQLGSLTTRADAVTLIKLDGTATKSFALNSTTTMGIAVPSGSRAGDVLIASVGVERSSATSQPALTAPPGWTLASRTNYSSTSALAVYSHVYATTDTSYTWTSNAAVGGGVEVSAFSGVDPVTPLAGSQGGSVTRASSVPTPSLTASAGSALVTSYLGYVSKSGTTTWTSPNGMTTLGQLNDSTKRTAMLAAYGTQATTGNTGAKVATASRTQDVGIGVITALKPAPSPPVVSGVAVTASTSTSLTVGWTTDVPASSQVDYGATASYGSSTTVDSTLVTQHSVTITGLTAQTAYHYRVRSTANGQTTVSDDNTATTATPSPPATPSLIVDTDMFSDADDAGALAVAFGLQLKGEAKVIAINVNTRTDRPVVAKESWGCVEAIAQFYGATGIPIGADGPANGTAVSSPDWATPCANTATRPLVQPDDALTVYRRALAAQPDGSVVIASTGFLENLSALLSSPPDSISPLSGRDLVAAKVTNLVIMGGQFPSGTAQTNLAGNVAASQNVVSNWPTKIVWAGSEVGDAIHTGYTLSQVHPSSSPVRAAYEAFVGPNNWIYSYDLAAVYAAIRPSDPALGAVGPGTTVVDSTGGTTFAAGTGNQYYLQLNDATSIDSSIEGLLDTLPTQLPPAGPVISGQQATAIDTQTATVTWTTNVVADSQVQYGTTTSYGSSSLLNTTLTTTHSVQLAALTPGTTYHYRVLSRDAGGNLSQSADLTFTTSTGQVSSGPSDTFDTNTLDTSKWIVGTTGSTVAAQNQELEITHPAGGWTTGSVQSATPYDQTGKSVQVQVRRAANAGQGGTTYGETSILITLDSTHYAEFFLAGSAATAWVNTGSGETNLTPSWPSYDANAMQWFRFRESGGTLYWETASGTSAPGSWSVLASAPDPFPMTQTTFKIVAGSNTATNDVASFDNIATN